MLHRIIASVIVVVAVGATSAPASAVEDVDVAAAMLAEVYATGAQPAQHPDTQRFYANRGYRPVWWQGGAWSAEAREAVTALAGAGRFGLSPERYGAAMLEGALLQGNAAALGPTAVAQTELALTEALLAYAGERAGGAVDPEHVGWASRRGTIPDRVALLEAARASGDLAAALDAIVPPRPGYMQLVDELVVYRAMVSLPWAPIGSGDSIKPGASDPRVPDLRSRLVLLGDHAPLPDDGLQDVARFVHDIELVAAVERFQRRHGLEPDGVVGRRTLAQLNVTPAERARTIVANLEKLRWMPPVSALGPRHVEINLPGYELIAYEGVEPVLVMPVIVGEPDHPTPVFSDRIVNLKFAPDWTVPSKIARNELLPKIQDDPSWLVANNYRVYADWGRGDEISPWSVDWAEVTPQTFSYLLRQQPGPASALGLIRFSLTNPQDIYLHDTGTRNLFGRASRSLSHGCVRVGDPLALAEFTLREEPEAWSLERIEAAMNATHTDVHRLASAVPVDFFYITAWVDADGRMQFRNDIYGKDGRLLEALDTAARTPVVALPLLVGSGDDDGGRFAVDDSHNVADLPL